MAEPFTLEHIFARSSPKRNPFRAAASPSSSSSSRGRMAVAAAVRSNPRPKRGNSLLIGSTVLERPPMLRRPASPPLVVPRKRKYVAPPPAPVVIDLDAEEELRYPLDWAEVGGTRYTAHVLCEWLVDRVVVTAPNSVSVSMRYAQLDSIFTNVANPTYFALQGEAEGVPEECAYDPSHISTETPELAFVVVCLQDEITKDRFERTVRWLKSHQLKSKMHPATLADFPAYLHFNPTRGARETRSATATARQATRSLVDTINDDKSGESFLLQYPLLDLKHNRDVVTLYANDVGHLEPGEFLNDNLIAFYLKYLMCEVWPALVERGLHAKRNVHVFSSFFYDKLKQSGYDSVRKWVGDTDIFARDFLFFPINAQVHWYLVVVRYPASPTMCSISVWDSMGVTRKQDMGSALRAYLRQEWKSKRAGQPVPEHLETIELDAERGPRKHRLPLFHVTVPGQRNFCDCGVFLLHYAELLLFSHHLEDGADVSVKKRSNELAFWFDPVKDIAHKRREMKQLILDLAAGSRNVSVVERIARAGVSPLHKTVVLPVSREASEDEEAQQLQQPPPSDKVECVETVVSKTIAAFGASPSPRRPAAPTKRGRVCASPAVAVPADEAVFEKRHASPPSRNYLQARRKRAKE